jgi:hypothetical protein
MLDRVACARMRLEPRPQVNWQAFAELKQLWDEAIKPSIAEKIAAAHAPIENPGEHAYEKNQCPIPPSPAQSLRSPDSSTPMGSTSLGDTPPGVIPVDRPLKTGCLATGPELSGSRRAS